MKKLFFFFALLMAMFFATNALAQQHVYINDPCIEGKPSMEWWNPNRVSKIGAVTPVVSSEPWAAWFYDAKYQIFGQGSETTDRIEGLQIVESNPFHVDETGDMFFWMDYYVLTLASSNMRNFGVRMRLNSGNEWDTLFAIRPEGGVFPSYYNYGDGYPGEVKVSIGDKYNGKNMVLQIFFYNDALADDAFIMAFKNVRLASYGTEPMIETELLSRRFASGDTYKATLNCINQSLTPLTSIEYAYSVNGKAEKKQSVSFADTLKGKGAVAAIDFDIDITEADIDTTNRILLWPVAVDGEAYAANEGDTLDFTLTVVDDARLDQDYVPLMECFTSATCQPCRQMNPYLNPVLAELKNAGKLNVVKYQMNYPFSGDRYYIAGNGTRGTYYKVTAVPTLIFSGAERPIADWGATTYNGLMFELRQRAEAASQNKAFFTIKVNKAEVTPDSTVELAFDVISHLPGLQRMTIHAVVIEGTVYGNKVSSAEKDFHYVNMAFATPVAGKTNYFVRDTVVDYSYSVKMKNTNMEELSDLQVVIFVQDPTDNYIYQSAGVAMGDGDHTAVEDEVLSQVSLYPNPASHTVYVKGLEKAHVEIFDLTGRRVYEKTDANDVLEVSLASFAKGAYVVRIAQNGAVASRKLVVK